MRDGGKSLKTWGVAALLSIPPTMLMTAIRSPEDQRFKPWWIVKATCDDPHVQQYADHTVLCSDLFWKVLERIPLQYFVTYIVVLIFFFRLRSLWTK